MSKCPVLRSNTMLLFWKCREDGNRREKSGKIADNRIKDGMRSLRKS
jgi:hypothetical protein